METWRKIKEIERCPECGSPLLVIRNDSNVKACAKCEDCGHETQLEFEEPYVYGKHGKLDEKCIP